MSLSDPRHLYQAAFPALAPRSRPGECCPCPCPVLPFADLYTESSRWEQMPEHSPSARQAARSFWTSSGSSDPSQSPYLSNGIIRKSAFHKWLFPCLMFLNHFAKG